MNAVKLFLFHFIPSGWISQIGRIYKASKLAVSGAEFDFTSGSINKAVFLLALPMVLEMFMESVFAIVDIYFVSKLGAGAVAVVGLTESVITLVYALAVGISAATTAMVSRRVGEKDLTHAGITAFQSIITSFAISGFISVAAFFYAADILRFMGASPELVSQYGGYTSIMLGTNGVIMLLFVLNAIFRSAGDAMIAMKVLFIGNALNILLDPLLIFGFGIIPAMGIEGAALATVAGRGIAVVYQVYQLVGGKGRIKLLWKYCVIQFHIIGNLMKLSAGGTAQSLIATTSWIILMRIVSQFGSEVLAGYTIALRIIVFSLLPAYGISNAAATLTGQNLGARKPERAVRAVAITGIINLILMGMIGVVMVCWPAFFIGLFIDDALVIERGAISLQIVSVGFMAYGLGMVMVNALNGAGDTYTPTWINLISYYLVEIPLAYVLAVYFHLNESGVYWAIVISETLMTFLAWLSFRRGRWKKKIV